MLDVLITGGEVYDGTDHYHEDGADVLILQVAEEEFRRWQGLTFAQMASERVFLRAPTHPRSYGSFARVLGHYVREDEVLPLGDATRRSTKASR